MKLLFERWKAYIAEQAAMEPNTTVADEVVANFTGQGLASAMPPTEMNPQEAEKYAQSQGWQQFLFPKTMELDKGLE